MLFYSRIQAKKPSRGSTDQGHGAFALLSNSAPSVFEVVDYYSDIVADGHKLSPAVDAGLQIGCRLNSLCLHTKLIILTRLLGLSSN
jgi:hypothetical protein